jgi:hypothetical protein
MFCFTTMLHKPTIEISQFQACLLDPADVDSDCMYCITRTTLLYMFNLVEGRSDTQKHGEIIHYN